MPPSLGRLPDPLTRNSEASSHSFSLHLPHFSRAYLYLWQSDSCNCPNWWLPCIFMFCSVILQSPTIEAGLYCLTFLEQWDTNNYDTSRDSKCMCAWPFFPPAGPGCSPLHVCLAMRTCLGQPVGGMGKTREPGWPGLLQLTLDDQALGCKPASCLPDLWVTPAEMRRTTQPT